MRTLLIDIETSPLLADVWGLWQNNVSLNQLHESSRMLCFAAKWLGEPYVEFWSEYHDGPGLMVDKAWSLLNEADVVMHYNGRRFDVPHLNREFLLAGLLPPSPFKHIDLLDTAKKVFKFPSNKLEYVSKALGLKGKVHHEGHALWTKVMAGDEAAWKRMETYNKRDVVLLEQLYKKLRPWITSHPSHAAFEGEHVCPRCGSDRLRKEGYAYTGQAKRQRYQCRKCGGWSQGTGSVSLVRLREA